MPRISLKGRITEKGELDLELPAGLPPGEARITIEIPVEPGCTPDELDRALEVVPLTGAEIVRGGFTGSWADQGISNGEDWGPGEATPAAGGAARQVNGLLDTGILEPRRVNLRAHGIDEAHAAELRARLSTFASEWDSAEMDVYDDYDTARARLQAG